jgi:membrane associated rhomboid family serine protease
MCPVSTNPTDPSLQTTEQTDPIDRTVCYRHSDTPTKLRCSRCDRPICGRCATPASVGQHCPECVAEARREAPKVRSTLQASAPGTYAIIAICIAVFVAQFLSEEVTVRFASLGPAIAAGEWWRLLTATFLHSTSFLLHILFNMFILYSYGPNVEQAFGTARYVFMYLAAGFTGSAASYAFNTCGGFSVGASGAIFGVMGILLVFLYNRRDSQFVRAHLNSILAFIAINLFLGFAVARIDNYAHIGGLIGGAVLGLGFDAGGRPVGVARQILTGALVVGAGIALVVWRTNSFTCVPG